MQRPAKDLPLSWFIEDGVPAPFINAAATLAEANIDLFRQRETLFSHNLNGKKLVCIPMGVPQIHERHHHHHASLLTQQ